MASLSFPFLIFTSYTYVQANNIIIPDLVNAQLGVQQVSPQIAAVTPIDWWAILCVIYLIGVLIMSIRLLLQLHRLYQLLNMASGNKIGGLVYIEVEKSIAPFSFFKYIIFNPSQYNSTELSTILKHEQVHCKQWHSIDMLLSELFLALQWYNPIAWLYKRSIQQNLEYIADSEATSSLASIKNYQHTLLKVSLSNYCTTITNNFFNSLIKKRILMINQQKSKKGKQFKLLLILPLLAIFLYSFNYQNITKIVPNAATPFTDAITFVSPINSKQLERISSNYGMQKSAFDKTMKMHIGIDMVAKTGAEVFATANGKVKFAGNNNENGNYIILEHQDGYSSKYMHLSNYKVSANQKVKASELIGHVGSTGLSTGPHLHFEILKDGKNLDPLSKLSINSDIELRKVIKIKEADKEHEVKDGEHEVEDIIHEEVDIEHEVEDRIHEEEDIDHNMTLDTSLSKVLIHINKNTTDADLEAIKKKMKAAHDYNFSYSDVVRNNKGHITAINLVITTSDGNINGNYNDSHGISDIILGEKKDGGLYFKAGDTHDVERVIVKKDKRNHQDNVIVAIQDNSVDIVNDKKHLQQPLIILDGKEIGKRRMEKLEVGSIESVNVLKDKAAIAKYGKKGKHGVIVIITKKD
jgi:murein DD-endopeptidase MepM/ murein hydrolase activator NlpD